MKEKFNGTKEESIALIKKMLDNNEPSKKIINDILSSGEFSISNNKALFLHIRQFFFDRYASPEIPKTSNRSEGNKLKQYYEQMQEIIKDCSDASLNKYYQYAEQLIEMSRPNKPDNTYFPFDEE